MTSEALLEQARQLLASHVSEWSQPEADRLDGSLAPEALEAAITTLKQNLWGYLASITAMDDGAEAGTIEVLYHFCEGAAVLTLRTKTPRDAPCVPSICAIYAYASPFEREAAEMLGIIFTNSPDATRLYLPDDWDEGIYPLRKDVDLSEVAHDSHE